MAIVSEHLDNKPPMDRISNLPDEIKIMILNKLPTKCAFISTTLSKRWKYLFEEVNQLDFDDSLLLNSGSSLNHDTSCVAFLAFIQKLLLSHQLPNLVGLRIKYFPIAKPNPECGPGCYNDSIAFWFSVLLSNRIQEFDLCFDSLWELPEALVTCKTVRVLKLQFISWLFIGDGVDVCMPQLRILHMKGIRPLEGTHGSITRLLAGCPLLDDFYIQPCSNRADEMVSISCPSVTKLKLVDYEYFPDPNSTQTRPLVSITAPLLQCLHYVDNLARKYSIVTSKNLVKAHLEISVHMRGFENVSAISRSACELIQGVSTVKCLFLSAHLMEALSYTKDMMPVLPNLTKLELACCANLHVLPNLLKIAPCLEQLFFSEGLFPAGFRDENPEWPQQEIVPSCLKTHVKIIKIKYRLGLREERRMVDYLLRNSHVLSELTIGDIRLVRNGNQVASEETVEVDKTPEQMC